MAENIFLFIPNIIGYARIALILAFILTFNHPWLAVALYLANVSLDELDGRAARQFNQCTNFGGMLDMVTDRLGSTAILAVLGHLYPSYIFIFQLMVMLDISSHWILTYSTALLGRGSHKLTDSSLNPLLRIYYIPSILTLFVFTNELFLASLYSLHFTSGFTVSLFGYEVGVWMIVATVTFPFQFMRQVICILQLFYACKEIAAFDIKQRLTHHSHEQ